MGVLDKWGGEGGMWVIWVMWGENNNKGEMGVPVRIHYRKFVDDMFWEFPSITRAAEFVKELAEWELQKCYTKKYISDLMSGVVIRDINVLYLLGLRVSVRQNKIRRPTVPIFGSQSEYYDDSDLDSDDSDSDDDVIGFRNS